MKRLGFLILVSLAIASATAGADTAKLRRFAVVIGANNGGPERTTLRYANSDAATVAKVLGELGGVASADTWILRDPTLDEVNRTLAAADARIRLARDAGARAELIIYYSGHSDDSGLLLGGQRYRYRDLRRSIERMPADVNIAVLDSCSSGSFTRAKGGTRRPPFLVDQSSQVRGYAFLSSSSADEAAQESDKIGASFFTHYFVSGLRGAADSNRDQKVTLSEAYRFAFDETVQRTESTQAGPQHPAYDMHLAGTGDVVMTDLRQTSAQLAFSAAIAGRLFVRDGGGRLAAELSKSAGQPIVIALEHGDYDIAWLYEQRLSRARVALGQGDRLRLAPGNFRAAAREATLSRGGPPGQTGVPTVPFRFSFVPGVSSATWFDGDAYVSINYIAGIGGGVRGFEFGSVANIDRGDVRGMQIGGIANVVVGRLSGVQIGGIGNVTRESSRGGQIGGIANFSNGDFAGVQIGGVANVVAADANALQIGGIANVNRGPFRGIQIGGIANVNATSTQGIQVGLINVGGTLTGAQIGLINVATAAAGLQLGLINYAKSHSGAPVGLLSWVEDGRHAIELWTSDTALAHVGTKLGSRRVYGLLAAATSDNQWHFGAGMGVHLPLPSGYIDADAVAYQLREHDFGQAETDLLAKLRIAYGLRLNSHLAAFVGASANFSFAAVDEGENPSAFGSKTFTRGGTTYRLSPGLFAGLSL